MRGGGASDNKGVGVGGRGGDKTGRSVFDGGESGDAHMMVSPNLMAPSAGAGASVTGARALLRVLESIWLVSMPTLSLAKCSCVFSACRYSSSAQLPTRQGTEKPPYPICCCGVSAVDGSRVQMDERKRVSAHEAGTDAPAVAHM